MTAPTKTYRIASSARALSAACSIVSGAALAAGALSPGSVHPFSLALAGAFFVLSMAANASNFGDRLEIHAEGVLRRNAFFRRRGTLLPWRGIAEAKRHGRRTLFVWDAVGKRHVFDHIHPFEEFAREMESRIEAAKREGTL